MPGWDCHGLPIEFKVTQDLRKAAGARGRGRFDPAAIRKACEAYARKYIDVQRAQFKRLGVLGDWDNPYLTLDKEYEAEELRLFADMVEQGFCLSGQEAGLLEHPVPHRAGRGGGRIQRPRQPEHLCEVPARGPARGFARDLDDHALDAAGQPGGGLQLDLQLLAGAGRARSSSSSRPCCFPPWPRNAAGSGYQIVRSLDGGHLRQLEYQHPFCRRTGRLFAGDAFVDNVTGTGFVHIAPGHGLEDYQLGSRTRPAHLLAGG